MAKPETEGAVETVAREFAADFDVHSPALAENVPELYEKVRGQCPVAHGAGHGGYDVLLRYDDVRAAAKDPARFSSENDLDGPFEGIYLPRASVRQGFLEMDPPDHSQFRRRLGKWMSPAAITEFEPRMREIAVEQIENALALGSFDAIDDLAFPFPAKGSLEFMGFPVEDWDLYGPPLHEQTYTLPSSPEFAATLEKIAAAQARMQSVIDARRAQPTDDLVSILIGEELDGEPLTDKTIMEMVWQIMGAGFDTVASTIGFAMKHMTEHPETKVTLRENPDMIPAAIEEFLRYFSPATAQARTVREPVEVGGEDFETGDRVLLCWAAANFDPEVFEDPLTLKIDRSPNRHLAFGDGIHKCMGARFGRVELKVFLEELLTRMPDFEVDLDRIVTIPTIALINGYISMPAVAKPA
jgi:cytochrome P450